MKLVERFKLFSFLTILAGLFSAAVHAHPGHVAQQSMHSLLHVEHIIALAAAGVVACFVFVLRNK
jgi:membrane protein DedA with SNARE-associated domain